MLAASLDNAIADHMDTIRWPDQLSTRDLLIFGDRASLRADLGQSQSGNSSLSPRAYRAQSTIAELAVWEIGPSTSVRAPRNYAGRSPQGAKTTCERWQDRSVASEDRNPVADNPPSSRYSIT